MTSTLRLAEQLIAIESPTPSDGPQGAGCMDVVVQRLGTLGFVAEFMEWGDGSAADSGVNARVRNLWLKRAGTSAAAKTFVFAGHTDVVPTGPLAQWSSPPFVPTHRNGNLYGRGAADMKTSIAAFVVAVENFLHDCPEPQHSIALLLTSDEEGPSINGTVKVCEVLKARQEPLAWCVVGEPTSIERTGDMIKNGRRGSLSGRLTVQGVQGHIAYPQLARNPIHLLAPVLADLAAVVWDEGNEYFPPTSWQVSNIHAGTGATNVIPGDVIMDFNFRYSTASMPESLKQRVIAILNQHGLIEATDFQIDWTLGGLPFLTPKGGLVQAVQSAIRAETGIETELSTTGGTSDGRFIAQICPEVIELGPPNASIHKIDEHVEVQQIEPLRAIYQNLLAHLVH